MKRLALFSLLPLASVLLLVPAIAQETTAKPGPDDVPPGLNQAQSAKWEAATDQQKARWRARLDARAANPPAARGARAKSERTEARNNNLGTIRYDPDAGPVVFLGNGGGSEYFAVGNVFNTASGSPLKASGSVTGISLFGRGPTVTATPTRGSSSFSATVSFFGPPGTMGTVPTGIGTRQLGPIPISSFQFVSLSPGVTVSGTFLAALYQANFTGSASVGLKTGSHNSQGFHAFQLAFAGKGGDRGTATYAPIPGHNAMLRATGNIILPVELMSFSIE